MTAKPDPVEAEAPLLSHLIEMRDRLLRVVISVLVVFVILFAFAGDLFEVIAMPYLESIVDSKMISTGPIDPFFTPMKLAIVLSSSIRFGVLSHRPSISTSGDWYCH
jgi:sec-independent protein translocase protein TatC